MPKRASGSSILHNLPKNKSKTPNLQHVNLPFLSAVKNNPPEKTGRHVTQFQFRFIALQYLGQKSSKFSPNLAFESFFDKYFIVISRFLNIFEQRHLFDDKHRRI